MIVPTDVPMTSALCQAIIDELVSTYPFCRSRIIGYSENGRPITALILGDGPKKVLYSAAHHANEWITAPVLLKFAEELAAAIASGGSIFSQDAGILAASVTFHLVPIVNPDGVDLLTDPIPDSPAYLSAKALAENYPDIPFPDGWKANALGVDLNLQYPAGWLQAREIKFSQGYDRPGPRDYVGEYPLSQAESRALAEYTQEIDPALVLAYHSQGQVIYWQFQDIVIPGAKELGEKLAAVSGYALEDTPYASAFAGYKDWFLKYFRRPGYTVEVGLGENPLPIEQFDRIYRDNLGILVTAAME